MRLKSTGGPGEAMKPTFVKGAFNVTKRTVTFTFEDDNYGQWDIEIDKLTAERIKSVCDVALRSFGGMERMESRGPEKVYKAKAETVTE